MGLTREAILEAIIQEVHRAVPEILELKEGCLMNVWWLKHFADIISGAEPDEVVSFTERTMKNNGHVQGKYWAIIEDNVMGVVEILGRPITLADILIAIGKKYGTHVLQFTGIETCSLEAARVVNKWDLTRPLHDQPLPTLQFIYELLVDKN